MWEFYKVPLPTSKQYLALGHAALDQCLYRDRFLFTMYTKYDVIRGAVWLSKNDFTQGQATALASHPDRKVNIAEELTYMCINIESNLIFYIKVQTFQSC
jgi:hypothetical protein